MKLGTIIRLHLLLLSVLLPTGVAANTNSDVATLNGRIHLANVGYLSGVRVTVTSQEGALLHNVSTDDQGGFSITFTDNNTVYMKFYDPDGRIENSVEEFTLQAGEIYETTYRFPRATTKSETATGDSASDDDTTGAASEAANTNVATVTGRAYSYTEPLAGIEVSASSEVSGGLISTQTNDKGEYSLDIPHASSLDDQVNLQFRVVDPKRKYKDMEFGAILYLDKTSGYDIHLDPRD